MGKKIPTLECNPPAKSLTALLSGRITNQLANLSTKDKQTNRQYLIHWPNRNGQGIVEFALVIPIILMLMMGIIEGGRILFIYSSVGAAAREASRYGAGVGSAELSEVPYKDCAGIRQAAQRIGQMAGVNAADLASITIQYDHGPSTTNWAQCSGNTFNPVVVDQPFAKLGDRVIVSVSINYSPVVPLVPFPSFKISGKNAHTIVKQVTIAPAYP